MFMTSTSAIKYSLNEQNCKKLIGYVFRQILQ
jgi:hypothetical protein